MRFLRPGLLLALAALLLLSAPAITLAQSGGGASAPLSTGYELTWWTADVGGGLAAGGAYALHGTQGQPEPGPLMTGGAYTLAGGFWQARPAAPMAVADLRATAAGATLTLYWSPVIRDVEGDAIEGATYEIYRGVDAPYFTATVPYDSVSWAWWSDDPGVVGDTGHSYYYLVRAVYSGLRSADSNRVGCFSFGLTPGGP